TRPPPHSPSSNRRSPSGRRRLPSHARCSERGTPTARSLRPTARRRSQPPVRASAGTRRRSTPRSRTSACSATTQPEGGTVAVAGVAPTRANGGGAGDAVICDPLRTPVGRFGGVFRGTPATELAAPVIREIVASTGLRGEDVDDVIMGQCYPNGEAPAVGRVA